MNNGHVVIMSLTKAIKRQKVAVRHARPCTGDKTLSVDAGLQARPFSIVEYLPLNQKPCAAIVTASFARIIQSYLKVEFLPKVPYSSITSK